jgi:hypothetical protein
MKIIAVFIAVACFTFTSASSHALSLELENNSSWDIYELYFSEADEAEWGPDQLDDDVVESGDSFTLTDIAKGMYDVKIVDEDGDSCEVSDVDFESSESFELTDELLIGCQIATAAEAEEE